MNNDHENTSLKTYQKYLELIYYTNDVIKKFPKSENFALTTQIRTSLYDGLKCLLYSIRLYNKKDKLKYLNELDINLQVLKIQIRLAYKYKYISLKNYETWTELIANIGNMLGRWIESCLKK